MTVAKKSLCLLALGTVNKGVRSKERGGPSMWGYLLTSVFTLNLSP